MEQYRIAASQPREVLARHLKDWWFLSKPHFAHFGSFPRFWAFSRRDIDFLVRHMRANMTYTTYISYLYCCISVKAHGTDEKAHRSVLGARWILKWPQCQICSMSQKFDFFRTLESIFRWKSLVKVVQGCGGGIFKWYKIFEIQNFQIPRTITDFVWEKCTIDSKLHFEAFSKWDIEFLIKHMRANVT